jgi:hypothetical protein
MDAPDVVHSLALLEPALFGRDTGQAYRESLAQGFVLPSAAHGLMMQNPRSMAEALANFWQRHPITASSSGKSSQ